MNTHEPSAARDGDGATATMMLRSDNPPGAGPVLRSFETAAQTALDFQEQSIRSFTDWYREVASLNAWGRNAQAMMRQATDIAAAVDDGARRAMDLSAEETVNLMALPEETSSRDTRDEQRRQAGKRANAAQLDEFAVVQPVEERSQPNEKKRPAPGKPRKDRRAKSRKEPAETMKAAAKARPSGTKARSRAKPKKKKERARAAARKSTNRKQADTGRKKNAKSGKHCKC